MLTLLAIEPPLESESESHCPLGSESRPIPNLFPANEWLCGETFCAEPTSSGIWAIINKPWIDECEVFNKVGELRTFESKEG